jgi:hypothetical protein
MEGFGVDMVCMALWVQKGMCPCGFEGYQGGKVL